MVKRIIYGAKSQLSHLNFQISFFTFKMQIIIVPISLDFLPVILYPANLSIKSACRTKIFSDFSDLKNIFLLKEYVFFGLFRPLPPPPGRRSGHTALALSSRLLLSQRRCRLPPVTIMISYRDLISHDEMFSDIYKIREVADGLCLEVEGKMVSRTEGNIDDSLVGGNASNEGPEGEGIESAVITGVDNVINHHLQETSFTKEAYKSTSKITWSQSKGNLKNRDQKE